MFGSLSMFPAAVDNYGSDSCSIMCLQTTPPIVIIAACSGKIYHAILLNENLEEDEKRVMRFVALRQASIVNLTLNAFFSQTWSQYGSTYSLHTPEEALYVYECVEMELGLFYTDNDKKYTCPIHLHADRANRSRFLSNYQSFVVLPIKDRYH